jgi:hypothetical protein
MNIIHLTIFIILGHFVYDQKHMACMHYRHAVAIPYIHHSGYSWLRAENDVHVAQYIYIVAWMVGGGTCLVYYIVENHNTISWCTVSQQ